MTQLTISRHKELKPLDLAKINCQRLERWLNRMFLIMDSKRVRTKIFSTKEEIRHHFNGVVRVNLHRDGSFEVLQDKDLKNLPGLSTAAAKWLQRVFSIMDRNNKTESEFELSSDIRCDFKHARRIILRRDGSFEPIDAK